MAERTIRDRLVDDLRYGPLTHYMMGWSEEQRSMVVDALADDLLRSYVLLPVDLAAHAGDHASAATAGLEAGQ